MLFKDKYFFLSTFYPVEVVIKINDKKMMFKNVEAAFQAQKNYDLAEKFELLAGLEAKKIAEDMPITTPNWEKEQLYAMANALYSKFKNYGLLFQLKLIKGDIINDNFWGDTFWGVYKGEGKNILGKMLMNIRDYNNDYDYLIAYINLELTRICTKDN